jgi:exodeoxyribonuclease-5
MQLTEEQQHVANELLKFRKLVQVMSGCAGSGKTTIAAEILKKLPDFGACAYTGKAAAILRKKGLSAQTIHSTIYQPYVENGEIEFILADSLPYSGLLVDEASMVPKSIFEDLCSFNIPLIFVGDHLQLEPINSDFNLVKNPDFKLETVHRFAGDIAKFANHLRKGYAARGFRGTTGEVSFLTNSALTDERLIQADQIICAYNKTRVGINNRVRSILGYTDLLHVNDRVMCLQNKKKLGLYNGMQGIVRGLRKYKRKLSMDFEFDNLLYHNIRYDPRHFGKEKPKIEYDKDGPVPFDYAYCGTAHKMQGDEFENVLAIEQRCPLWNHRRWSYTVASRAMVHLDWVLA